MDDEKTISEWLAERRASGERGLKQFLQIATCDELNRRTSDTDLADVVARVRARMSRTVTDAQIHAMIAQVWPRFEAVAHG